MEDLKLEFQKIEEQAEVVVEKDNMCQVVIQGNDMNHWWRDVISTASNTIPREIRFLQKNARNKKLIDS